MEYKLAQTLCGMSQSALPKTDRSTQRSTAASVKYRAVVIHSYFVDDKDAQLRSQIKVKQGNRNLPGSNNEAPTAEMRHVYCDVFLYSSQHGVKKAYLQRVLVGQPQGAGLHTGELWVPRPSTIHLNGEELPTALTRMNPGTLDGDHVIVEFLDNDPKLPIITGSVPHPARDVGVEQKTNAIGTRQKIAGGFPKLTKFNGVVYGVDSLGNFVIDASRAHTGKYDSKGREPRLDGDPADSVDAGHTVPTDGSSGNVVVQIRPGSSMEVRVLTDPANPGDAGVQTTSILFENGRITLQVNTDDPSTIVMDGNDITLDANNDQGNVITRGAVADMQTDQVHLGDGAAHPVMWGDNYNQAHQTLDTALQTFLGQWGAALGTLNTAIASAIDPTVSAAVTAYVGSLAAAFIPLIQAIVQFDGVDAPNALSQDVDTR